MGSVSLDGLVSGSPHLCVPYRSLVVRRTDPLRSDLSFHPRTDTFPESTTGIPESRIWFPLSRCPFPPSSLSESVYTKIFYRDLRTPDSPTSLLRRRMRSPLHGPEHADVRRKMRREGTHFRTDRKFELEDEVLGRDWYVRRWEGVSGRQTKERKKRTQMW